MLCLYTWFCQFLPLGWPKTTSLLLHQPPKCHTYVTASSVGCMFSCHFLRLYGFVVHSGQCVYHINWSDYQIHSRQIFPPASSPFSLFKASLCHVEAFQFDIVHLFISFCLCTWGFSTIFQKTLPMPVLKNPSSTLSSGTFTAADHHPSVHPSVHLTILSVTQDREFNLMAFSFLFSAREPNFYLLMVFPFSILSSWAHVKISQPELSIWILNLHVCFYVGTH